MICYGIKSVRDFIVAMQEDPKIVLASGFFDPIQPAHLDYLREAKSYGDVLVVIVNGDDASIRKKGYYFYDCDTRCALLDAYGIADFVLPCPDDDTSDVIKELCPHILTQGGDRREDTYNQKEIDACLEIECRRVYGVGGSKKKYSSSNAFYSALYMYSTYRSYDLKKRISHLATPIE